MWTEKKLQQLQQAGKIRGYVMPSGQHIRSVDVKKSKYGNKKTVVDDMVFDSKKEARRWGELKLLLKAGEIGILERQVPYTFVYQDVKVGKYIADFRYVICSTGETVVEDVKSEATRKLAVYRFKKRMMKACFKIEIKEV